MTDPMTDPETGAARGRYAAHEILVAPARARPALWRLCAGLVLAVAIAFALTAALQAALVALAPEQWRGGLADGRRPGQMLVLLGGFGFVTLGVFVAARALQGRAAAGLIGPLPLAARQFWRVLRALLVLGLVIALLPPHDLGLPLDRNLAPGRWLALLPLALLAVLIQTSAEEILFRGYLQQGLAARFARPAVWLILPSALFAAGHFVPAEAGPNAPLIALWAGLFGLAMADLTARAGTLGPAIAVHFFNNVIALLILGAAEGLNGLALFTLPFDMADTGAMRQWLVVDFAMMGVSWLTARLALRR